MGVSVSPLTVPGACAGRESAGRHHGVPHPVRGPRLRPRHPASCYQVRPRRVATLLSDPCRIFCFHPILVIFWSAHLRAAVYLEVGRCQTF